MTAPHLSELVEGSGIPLDLAVANVASFGAGTERHWEDERSELVAHARLTIQTGSTTASGHAQTQPGYLADRLIRLDQRYRHLQHGGWRTLSDALPGLPVFDQCKPDRSRQRHDKPGSFIKYEAPPAFPDGGGLLLPRIPETYWRRICERSGLPFPDAAARTAGFWVWALATPGLQLLICEGWKKALAAIACSWAAVALPGVQMGRRRDADGRERLIPALQLLNAPGRCWLITFDAEAKPSTAAKVGAAAGCLARALRAVGGRPEIARLPLLPCTAKTGLDDLLVARGAAAVDAALADTGRRPVLPWLRPADRVAPAGQWLGDACPIPSPEVAPLVVLQAPMGSGKTEAVAQALAPLAADGVPVLMPSHRQALGQAAAERVGVPWRPEPGSDERQQGAAACWDSWYPHSAMRISGHGWSGGAAVLDEFAQAVEHLLLSTGTALADHRAAVLRTAADQLPRLRQTIAADAQMPEWAVRLLEALTGRRALVIRSEHQPMAGRLLHCPEGLKTPQAAAEAFRCRWLELVAAGQPFLCWTTAQQAGSKNAPQTLAAWHRQQRHADLVDVIDSTTPELPAELAADPDGFAERRMAEAAQQGGSWALYCSPAISSGVSFSRWKPAAVIALAGGHVAPEHAAQALARVRCPEVPAWLFAPEQAPGNGLRVGSGSTDPEQLIRDLRAVADPLLGQLEDAGDPWLQAWAELGATRNRQRFAYRATAAGLLEREGWAPLATSATYCTTTAKAITADLQAICDDAVAAADAAIITAPVLEPEAAAALERRRKLEPADRAARDRHRIRQAWGLGEVVPSPELLEAHRDKLRDRLRLGWLLTTPEALALIPHHDQQRIAALDATGRPFGPDRLRVSLAPKLTALVSLGLSQMLQRFKAGEVIAATDPAVVALHAAATAHRGQLAAAAGISPGVKATGTLRRLLQAVGWQLNRAGRSKGRGDDRDAYIYRAEPMALPAGVDAEALAAVWLAELQNPIPNRGAKSGPIGIACRGQKSPTPSPVPDHPPPRLSFLAMVRSLAPPVPHQCRPQVAA